MLLKNFIEALELHLEIDTESELSVHGQIASALKRSILDGHIRPGQKLPSVRTLAANLNVARSTVLRSLDDLASQGYIETVHGSGCFVKSTTPGDVTRFRLRTGGGEAEPLDLKCVLSDYGKALTSMDSKNFEMALTYYGGPEPSIAPYDIWRELQQKHCRFRDLSKLEFEEESFGFRPLREAYLSYLVKTRAVRADASQIAVFSARELRFDLICRLLLKSGDIVCLENPGYPGLRSKIVAQGAEIVPVRVDSEGIVVDEIFTLKEIPRLVYISPSHHEPSGAVLSLPRRERLLAWADRHGVFIVEDDYDSEFRYRGRSLPSLQGMDQGGWVIHLSCLWKVLSPLLTLGFLVVPNRILGLMNTAKALIERDLPIIDQFALTDFINEGHLDRHTRKARRLYSQRHDRLIEAIDRHARGKIVVAPESAGMDLLIKINSAVDSEAILDLARSADLDLYSTRDYYLEDPPEREFIIPFAYMDENSIEEKTAQFCSRL